MESAASHLTGRVPAGAAFALTALALVVLPRLAFGLAEYSASAVEQFAVNVLFFLPQFAFPFAITPRGHSYGAIAVSRGAVLAGWAALTVAFAFAAARLRPRWLILATPAAVVACVIALQLVLAAFGYGVELDGP